MRYRAYHNATPASRLGTLSRYPGGKLTLKTAAIATPSDWAAWGKARDLANAQADLRDALDAFEAARLAIAASNRLFRKKRHDRVLTQNFVAVLRRRDAFVAINRARGKIVRARKALAKLADA